LLAFYREQLSVLRPAVKLADRITLSPVRDLLTQYIRSDRPYVKEVPGDAPRRAAPSTFFLYKLISLVFFCHKIDNRHSVIKQTLGRCMIIPVVS
jgi:hypothetical protein